MQKLFISAGTFLVLTLSVARAAVTFDVPLTINETAGVERRQDICSTGVPLPCGALKTLTGIAVFDPAGKAVPAQFKVLERWREKVSARNDLSVKWLLVTFLADVPAGGSAVYRLKAGENPAPAKPVTIIKQDQGHVLNGLVFKADGSAPFEMVMTDADDKAIPASSLASLKWSLWEEGPVRACLAGESKTEDGKYGLMVWVYSYAGKSRWDLTVVLKNTPNKGRGPMYFKDFSVSWKPESLAGAREFLLGGNWDKTIKGTIAGESAYLYQDSDGTDSWETLSGRRLDWRTKKWRAARKWDNAYVLSYNKVKGQGKPAFRGYKVFNGEKEIAAGNSAQGWAVLNGKSGALMSVRHFLYQYPKAIEVQPGKLLARLWPKYWKAHGGTHWLDDLQRKAHDISFELLPESVTAEKGLAVAKAFDHPLIIHCGTDWYRQTGAYGFISKRFKDAAGQKSKLVSELVSNGRTWVTLGGDLSDRIRRRYHQQKAGPFIRLGGPGRAMGVFHGMRHCAGIDPMWPDDYQYPRDSKLMKIGYCSPARKAGKYRAGTGHHGYMPWNNQHFMAADLYDGWRLFGDPLALDSLRDVATYQMFYFDRRNAGGRIPESRLDALPLTTIAHCYRILGDEAILKSMRDFVHKTVWRDVHKERGYYVPNRNVDGGSDKPFMLSTLMDGLREYWRLTDDQVAEDLMLGITDFCVAEGFLNDYHGFRYTIQADLEKSRASLLKERNKEKKSRGGYRAWQMFRPLAWAYLNTGEKDYQKVFVAMSSAAKKATVWRHKGSPNPDSSDWGYICDQVRDVPREDAVAPAAITDLKAQALGAGKVKLSWTTPADAVRLRIKWAARPMVKRLNLPAQKETHVNWWAANNVSNQPQPKAGVQSMVVDGVKAGTQVFNIRSFDKASNRSGFSNQIKVEVK
jgi:hypothetical protein